MRTFSSDEPAILSDRKYNLLLGGITLYGLIVTLIVASIFNITFSTVQFIALICGQFACIFIFSGCKTSNLKLLVFTIFAFLHGLMFSTIKAEITSVSFINALVNTCVITAVMLAVSCWKPEFFLSLGSTLLTCLFAVVAVELVMLLLGFLPRTWWDVIVILLFCLFIGYDWSKAQSNSKTAENALDTVMDLYLDILNIFTRFLNIDIKKSRS